MGVFCFVAECLYFMYEYLRIISHLEILNCLKIYHSLKYETKAILWCLIINLLQTSQHLI